MEKLTGSIYVLSVLPIWAIVAILFAVMMLSIFVGRDILEGFPYNVSYSAVIGDAGLIICILIAATILQRGGVDIPQRLQDGETHAMIFFSCVWLGMAICAFTLESRSGQAMDIYHDIIVAPLFLYLAITLVPIIYLNGTKVEIAAVVCFVLLWAALVSFDIKYERLNQRQWLQNHCIIFKR
jgi:hypothetical protein